MSLERKLFLAARQGDIKSLQEILQQPINLDVMDDEGNTALILAILNDQVEVARLLCAKGANVHIKNKKGLSAIQQAALVAKDKSCVNLLLDAGAKFDSELHRIAFEGRLEELKTYFQQQLDIINDSNNNTVLHYAAANGHLKSVQWLVDTRNMSLTKKIMMAVRLYFMRPGMVI